MFVHSSFLVIFLLVSSYAQDKGVWQMIPSGQDRIIDVHSTLTMTCICPYQGDFRYQNLSFRWELPDFLVKNPQVRFKIQTYFIFFFKYPHTT